MDEVPRRLVIDAARVGDERALHNGGAVDGRRVAVECIEIHDPGSWSTVRVENPDHVIDGLNHETVPHAQTLIRRFYRELIAAVGEALLVEVQSLHTEV